MAFKQLNSKYLSAFALAALLSACGGGGGDSVVGGASESAENDLTASCVGCGASDASTYSGSGTAIWHNTNNSTSPQQARIVIHGLENKDVLLVFTNESTAQVTMPTITAVSSVRTLSTLAAQSVRTETSSTAERISEFNRRGWTERIQEIRETGPAAQRHHGQARVHSTVGSSRTFYNDFGDARTVTLRSQTSTQDGTVVNLWVENGEFTTGKVTAAHLSNLASAFNDAGKIYDSITQLTGPLWGAHSYPAELISGSNQPVDIMLINIEPDNLYGGVVGYFWALHNFLPSEVPISNGAPTLVLDTETLYLYSGGLEVMTSTLAHEAAHMANFYNRGVLKGPQYQFDVWLEEMTAMMYEDIIFNRLGLTEHPIRDMRLPQYLWQGNYNCELMVFYSCDGYAVSGSFGGFLLRQLGVPFYMNLVRQDTTDSRVALQNAIRSVRPSSGIGTELRKFSVAAIGAVPSDGPSEFSFRGRSDSGYVIEPIDADLLAGYRSFYASTPAQIRAYASIPVLRQNRTGTFSETVTVPPGTTVSVVVR